MPKTADKFKNLGQLIVLRFFLLHLLNLLHLLLVS